MLLLFFPFVLNSSYNFESGTNDADASGIGDLFTATGGSTFTYDNGAPIKGTLSGQFNYPASSAGYETFNLSPGSQLAVRFYIRVDTAPLNSFFSLRSSSGVMAQLTTGSSGRLVVSDSAGTNWGLSTNPITANTIYRVELVFQPDVSGGDGIIDCSVYPGDSTTPIYDIHTSAATLTTGPIAAVRIGRSNATGAAGNLWIDDLAFSNQTAGRTYIGSSTPLLAGLTGEIKAYVGGTWTPKPVKVWTGTAWVVKPLKRWNGTAWVVTPY